jgi:hypothetical protein
MKEKNMEIVRTGMKVGALLGGVAFLIFGIVPGFHYGGYGTLMLLSKIAGGPLEFTLGIRLVVILGTLLGILCLASMSIVIGSVLGTVSGYVVNAFSKAPEAEEEMVNHSS